MALCRGAFVERHRCDGPAFAPSSRRGAIPGVGCMLGSSIIFTPPSLRRLSLNGHDGHGIRLYSSVFAIGGFLVGSSSSQEPGQAARREVGRYQMIALDLDRLLVFDTKTAHYWRYKGNENWSEHSGPVGPRVPAAPNQDGKPEAN